MNEIRSDMQSELMTSARRAESKAPTQPVQQSGKELPQSELKVADVSAKEIEEVVSRLNERVQETSRTLNFQVDEDSGKTVIRVYDKSSNDLIRQIPNELALELAKKLSDDDPSFLFTAQV